MSITDWSVEILLTSGHIIHRNCNDILVCSRNSNSQMDIDLLDYPIYPRPLQDDLTRNESQFKLFLPEINPRAPDLTPIQEEQPVDENILGETEDNPDEVSDDLTEDSTTDYLPPMQLGLRTEPGSERRMSSRQRKHTTKYLEMFQ